MSALTAVRSRVGPGKTVAHRRAVEPPPGPERFARFASAAVALTSIPYLWVLWDMFTGGVDPLRSEKIGGNFYDLQGRAILGGHLWLPNGALGIEAFVHAGRQFTYFGVFPSLIRIPFLLVTHSLDGRLTAPSMLASWLLTAIFSSLLIWRVRVMGRGDAALGRAEASALAIVVGTITGGSVLVYLAATPWVFDEDFAWSVALALGSLFALLGVLERPSRRRFVGAGVMVLLASLDRAPIAYGLELGAIGIAVWFAWFSKHRDDPKRHEWAVCALAVALVPLAVAGAINTAKFGSPFALPMASQVWTSVNAHRRAFLAANGGRAFSFGFLPSTLAAYMNPAGLHFSSVFPYIEMPTTPARAVAGAVLDQTYPTSSVPASMPLLFLLGCWGLVTIARPRPPGQLHLARIPAAGAAAGCAGVLLWGYIAGRYLSDFLPVLVLTAAVGLVDIWRRLEGRPRRARTIALSAFAALGVFGVAANTLLSLTPEGDAWGRTQLTNLVSLAQSLSNLTGHPLNDALVRADRLPLYAPEGTLYDVNNCSGLYLSSGYSYASVPAQQYEHGTWMVVEQGRAVVSTFNLVFEPALADWNRPFTILRSGQSAVVVRLERVTSNGTLLVRFDEADPHHPAGGLPATPGVLQIQTIDGVLKARPGVTYKLVVVADPYLDHLTVTVDRGRFLSGPYTPGGPLQLLEARGDGGLPLVSETPVDVQQPTPICDSLTAGS